MIISVNGPFEALEKGGSLPAIILVPPGVFLTVALWAKVLRMLISGSPALTSAWDRLLWGPSLGAGQIPARRCHGIPSLYTPDLAKNAKLPTWNRNCDRRSTRRKTQLLTYTLVPTCS